MSPHHRRIHENAAPPADDGALTCAYRILARRDHTRWELSGKLRRKGFSPRAVDHAVRRCLDLGYLDDMRTAEHMAADLVRRGYGSLKIRQTLARKGLDDAVVEQAVSGVSRGDDLILAARRMLEKKRHRLDRETDAWKRRQLACRYLASRGFSRDVIDRVVGDGFD
jgi:regulatory protein